MSHLHVLAQHIKQQVVCSKFFYQESDIPLPLKEVETLHIYRQKVILIGISDTNFLLALLLVEQQSQHVVQLSYKIVSLLENPWESQRQNINIFVPKGHEQMVPEGYP